VAAQLAFAPGDHIGVAVDERRRVVRVARTALPLSSSLDIGSMIGHVQRSLQTLARARYAVLIDIRRALLASESRYADASVALRRELLSGFRKSAFLVETQMGMLQVQRFAREERLSTRVYLDELEALTYLAQS
jgi:hypothetical protein